MMKSIDKKLGTPIIYSILSTLNSQHQLGFPILAARTLTIYEHGNAVETFSFQAEGKKELLYYHIDSEALIDLVDEFGF